MTSGSRTVLPRQQTLRALIDWSYDLLVEAERRLLRRLSVFVGGWTLEAAEVVCADAVGTDVLECLAHLVDKSLVEAEERTGSARYRMLETIRQYAHEKLLESSEGPGITRPTSRLFRQAGNRGRTEDAGERAAEWLDRLEAEIDNIRSALLWSREAARIEAGLSLATSLYWFWYLRGHRTEGLDWLQTCWRSRYQTKPPSCVAEHFTGWLRRTTGTAITMQPDCWLAKHSPSARSCTISRLLPRRTGPLAEIAYFEGDLTLAGSMSEQALAMSRAAGDRYQIGSAALMVGFVALLQGAYAQAEQSLAECVRLVHELGDKNMLSTADRFWGYTLLYQDNDSEAEPKFRESLTLNWELRDTLAVGSCFAAYASLAVARERFQHSARMLGATDHVCESLNQKLLSWDWRFYDRAMLATRDHLDKATFETAWAEGHALTLEQAIATAVQVTVRPGPAGAQPAVVAAGWGGLSDRERDVARLLAQGLSNREIAETLVLSRRTVETHVANIFNKLGFNSRAQVRQWVRDKPVS